MPESDQDLAVVELFKRAEELFARTFEIERLVSASGHRVLFVGWDTVLKRRVAMRVHLRPDVPSRAWFEQEIQVMARLDHPSLRTIYSAGFGGDWAYRLTQWIDGESLADAVHRGALAIPTTIRMAHDLAEAVEYAHSEDVILRQIAPATTLLDRAGRAVITDMRFSNPVLEMAEGEPGAEEALPFLAPECRDGSPGTPAADIYALGALLYFAVTGGPPAVDTETITPPTVQRPACPAALESIIMRALSSDLGERYLTASELVADITGAVGEYDFHAPGLRRYRADENAEDFEARLRRALGTDYELLDQLGAGAFGRVFRVMDLRLEREVALKVLHPHLAADLEVAERFRREARLAAQLNHQHIVDIYDIDSRLGFVWYTMAYVDGFSLATLVQNSGSQKVPFVLRLLREAASALRHAHSQGVVHRDLKPENILLSRTDGSMSIADFGLALALRASNVFGGATSRSGTPEFAAPEQLLGETVDQRTDIYSLCLVGAYAILGRPPFTGRTPEEILAQQTTRELPSLGHERHDVPEMLEQILARGAHRNPAERFDSAADLLDTIHEMIELQGEREPWYRRVFT
ncbi:MAG: serine/threonine-protein kinase [Gemmatimonadales bacterium]